MFDQLFFLPFVTGLAFALVLPVLGAYLRLRDEWLAALAYAHLAAAGALLGLTVAWPPVVAGLALAAGSGLAKQTLIRRLGGGAAYALLLLAAWAGSILLAANLPTAERLGHALFDGQLYFADIRQAGLALASASVALWILHRLSNDLLLARIYPDLFRLRARPAALIHGGFDLLAAVVLAIATMSLGVMGAFVLVFVPPWLAFRRATSWRVGLVWSVGISVVAYLAAFAIALALDQPFGPVLALLLVCIGILIA